MTDTTEMTEPASGWTSWVGQLKDMLFSTETEHDEVLRGTFEDAEIRETYGSIPMSEFKYNYTKEALLFANDLTEDGDEIDTEEVAQLKTKLLKSVQNTDEDRQGIVDGFYFASPPVNFILLSSILTGNFDYVYAWTYMPDPFSQQPVPRIIRVTRRVILAPGKTVEQFLDTASVEDAVPLFNPKFFSHNLEQIKERGSLHREITSQSLPVSSAGLPFVLVAPSLIGLMRWRDEPGFMLRARNPLQDAGFEPKDLLYMLRYMHVDWKYPGSTDEDEADASSTSSASSSISSSSSSCTATSLTAPDLDPSACSSRLDGESESETEDEPGSDSGTESGSEDEDAELGTAVLNRIHEASSRAKPVPVTRANSPGPAESVPVFETLRHSIAYDRIELNNLRRSWLQGRVVDGTYDEDAEDIHDALAAGTRMEYKEKGRRAKLEFSKGNGYGPARERALDSARLIFTSCGLSS